MARRGFLVGGLAAGFAAAAGPVRAEAIVTSAEGLEAGEVKVPVKGGGMPAYRAMPAQGGPFPVVLVVQEIFGVHEHIRDVCRRLAKLGYYAIAPELYARQGDVSRMTGINEIISKVVSKVPDSQVMDDLDSVAVYAGASGKGDVERLGITGFCWGGRAVWLYAAHNPKIKAGVAWYGLLAEPMWDKTAPTALQAAAELKAPVLGLYAGKDKFIPESDVEKMRQATQGKGAEIVFYPQAEHGFHADYRPAYDPVAAKDGWERLVRWFKVHGVV
ncbi:MAG: dienelactone hydrolase family protein [Rhodospirillales bacterium]|nr:dienelactone hydrolase family protein [Rhodospirillales bacterium]